MAARTVAVLLLWPALEVGAQDTLPPSPPQDSARARPLEPVRVTGRQDDLIGTATSASEGRVGAADLRARPIARTGELLETVPGVIVTQHSGEGKANQYFVRGFNLDHGTDFQTRVDGMPVNLPTHGHGQGWTDLNFLIPELIDHLDYRLGVHHAEIGDFGSAGAAEFHLRRRLDRPFTTVERGENGLARLVAGVSTGGTSGSLLLGGETKAYDGPWLRAARLRKLSGMARYTIDRGTSSFSLLALAYRSRWNANDQIPDRAVASRAIGRFGQVDSTDGGNGARYSLSGSWRRLSGNAIQEVQLFGVRTDLLLFSNFTFFLDDPARGDQFSQTDRRTVVGGNATHSQEVVAAGVSHLLRVGVQSRADLIGSLGLHRTERQVRHATVREDRVAQTGTGVFLSAESRWRPWLRSVLGLRGDGHTFAVRSDRAENSGRRGATIVSPKASLVIAPSAGTELYLSGGFGFHSNDARGITITIDPASGAAASQVDPLVRSRGAEVGMRVSRLRGLRSTLALWTLGLDSELLFVGDAGTTEASAASRRRGITFANFYRPRPELALDADLSFARARLDLSADANRIPGALERVMAGGVSWSPTRRGLLASARLRHFGAYPLIEDNSVRARAATLTNADVGYQFTSGTRLRITVLNAANVEADDIRYFYRSRLQGEHHDGIEDVHSHAVEPRQVRVSLDWRF